MLAKLFLVVFQMLPNKRADEVITVIVPLMIAQCQRLTGVTTGLFQRFGEELCGQELVVESLVDEQIGDAVPGLEQSGGVVGLPVLLIFAEVVAECFLSPRAAYRCTDRCECGDRAEQVGVTQRQSQRAVSAHRMTGNADAIRICGELFGDDVAQFLRDIAFHAVMLRPRRLRCVEIKPGAGAEVPSVGFAGNAGLARAGVHRDQHQAELSGVALRSGFDHEGFFGAGQSSEEKQRGNGVIFGLRRLINGEAHRQADYRGWMLVVALNAAKTVMQAAGFECCHDQ